VRRSLASTRCHCLIALTNRTGFFFRPVFRKNAQRILRENGPLCSHRIKGNSKHCSVMPHYRLHQLTLPRRYRGCYRWQFSSRASTLVPWTSRTPTPVKCRVLDTPSERGLHPMCCSVGFRGYFSAMLGHEIYPSRANSDAKLPQRRLVRTSLILIQCKTVPCITSSVEVISHSLMSSCGNRYLSSKPALTASS
jgi:hypothetical protein